MTWNHLIEIIFWSSLAALVYTYAGYPVLVAFVALVRPQRYHRGAFEPKVSVIITAYNEERDLRGKIENTLAIDYPHDLLEIIVASDASTDRTDEIVREFAPQGVRLHRQPERLGKTPAQNAAVERAQGEILLFSDATTMYQPNVLRAMLPNFADASVGCVAGRLVYVDPTGSSIGYGAVSYWNYETFLKRQESRACSLIGASGCLYAVRRSAYLPLYPEAHGDFLIATKMIQQGLRTVFEPEAVCTEETNRRVDHEMNMRVRVITQTFNDLWKHRAMLNPLRGGFFGVQLLSHKWMRYFVPFFLVGILASSALLFPVSAFYRVLVVAQICAYVLTAGAWLLTRTGFRNRLLALPQYFLLANVASVIAFYRFLSGERFARWEPIRGTAPTLQRTPTVAPHELH
ncbi:MAG TPA: glycosyltransferase family 2 protein [Pyrinomonadaceae bacterium]|jgi:cellulose synthase/poly-beta-1,6-N-acetylglucosamine synthase-like glycosyltransferase